MAEAVVDRLEVVEVGHDDRDLVMEALGAGDLGAEGLVELPAVRKLGQLIRRRELACDPVEVGVLERDRGAARKPFCELDIVVVEATLRRVEDEEPTGHRATRERSRAAGLPRSSSRSAPAPRRRRRDGADRARDGDGAVEDHGRQRVDVVARSEDVADECRRLACAPCAERRGRLVGRPAKPLRRGRASLAARNARKTTEASEARTARRTPPALADCRGDRAVRRERGEPCRATAGRERSVPLSFELERARRRRECRLAGDEPVAGRERSPRRHRGDRYLHEDAADLARAADDGRGGGKRAFAAASREIAFAAREAHARRAAAI